MDWSRHRASWPHSGSSRFVAARPHRWHVQVMGAGQDLLLLHGTGGATQSWRGLMPLLASRYRVIAPDLPGQGFTRPGGGQRCGLGPMAEDLWRLLDQEGWRPVAILGHSAGGALALQMALTARPDAPLRVVIGLNAALGSFDGLAGWLFPALARLLAMMPGVPALFSRLNGSERCVADLLAATGSDIGPEGRALYRALVADADHVEGTLAMMAQWNVAGLLERLPGLGLPVRFLVAENDRTVPPPGSATPASSVWTGLATWRTKRPRSGLPGRFSPSSTSPPGPSAKPPPQAMKRRERRLPTHCRLATITLPGGLPR